MTEGWMPCSDSSLGRQDPLEGTAGYGERWFLVEIDGAWGEHAFLQSRLEPALGRQLVTRIERAGIRPLAIRRTGKKADERRSQSRWKWAYVDARAGHETVRWGVVDDPRMLLDVPLDGSAGVPSSDPVIAVCTHARHDQCCAVKGRPVVTALVRAYPKLTWECSHLGGDRFAATMVVFPHGLFYGRVHPAEAPGIIEQYRDGVIDERYFRGRSSLTNATQAAQGFARSACRDFRIDAFASASEERADDSWTVRLDHNGSPVTVVLSQTLSQPMLSNCSATRAAPVRQFELTSITAG